MENETLKYYLKKMPTSPKNRNCLELEEIRLYVQGEISSSKAHSIESHLLGCELCNDAVEGFRVQGFTKADIPAFETLARPSRSPVSLTRWISIAAIVLIGTTAGLVFNNMNKDKEAEDTLIADSMIAADSLSSTAYEPEQNLPDKNKLLNELADKDKEVKELITLPIREKNDQNQFGKKDLSVWMMPQKKIEVLGGALIENQTISVHKNFTHTFIFDLKITSYAEFYEVPGQPGPEKTTATEARYEKKEEGGKDLSRQDLEKLTTEDVLIKAMDNFSKNNFTNALKLFNILLSYESEDVNSLFYGAICYKNLNRMEDAIGYLDRVLLNTNTSFYEEAEWEKAQVYVQLKDFKKAELLLDKIFKEKGFYAERARDLLKRVKVKNRPKEE